MCYFETKNWTHLDDVIKKYKNRKKTPFLGKNDRNTYFTILHPINVKLLHLDDSECISIKFILEK